jgi:hypothetical protein
LRDVIAVRAPRKEKHDAGSTPQSVKLSSASAGFERNTCAQ